MKENRQPGKGTSCFLSRLLKQIGGLWNKVVGETKEAKDVNVYFISGMCYNCKVFDRLRLPQGYKKNILSGIFLSRTSLCPIMRTRWLKR